jgi:hypothetical protein
VSEHYVDGLVYIQIKNQKMVLALFDNNTARVLDAKDFSLVQELVFVSDYWQTKEEKKKTYGTPATKQTYATTSTERSQMTTAGGLGMTSNSIIDGLDKPENAYKSNRGDVTSNNPDTTPNS